MKLVILNQVMGKRGFWTGQAHRFIASSDEEYSRFQRVAASLEGKPKNERIRWWKRGSVKNERGSIAPYIDIAMH